MKSRRQSSGGSASAAAAAAAAAGGEGNNNNTSSGGGCSKMERKDVEKNRRLHMKGLCLKLSSLIPDTAKHHHLHCSSNNSSPPSSKDTVTQLDHLDKAAAYIKQLKERIDELKQRKEGAAHFSSSSSSSGKGKPTAGAVSVSMPVIEVRYQDATLDVVLISKVGKPFKLHEVITVLEQEGGEVVNASFSVVGDKIFYTIHSQALSSRIGLEASRVSERLRHLLV